MVCLEMKTILILRNVLNYSDVGWSYYTNIPFTNLQKIEWPGNSEYPYEVVMIPIGLRCISVQ